MAEVNLSAALRSADALSRNNLGPLQGADSAGPVDMAQRLAATRKTDSPIDHAGSFFAATSIANRTTTFAVADKNQLDHAAATLAAATHGITNIQELLAKARGIAMSGQREAISADDRRELANAFNNVVAKINQLAGARESAQGAEAKQGALAPARQNLLAGGENNKLTVDLGNGRQVTVDAQNVNAQALGLQQAKGEFTQADAAAALNAIEKANHKLVAFAVGVTSAAATVTLNQDTGSSDLISSLQSGSEKLRIQINLDTQDANKHAFEAARQLAAQQASVASQANQSVVKLLLR